MPPFLSLSTSLPLFLSPFLYLSLPPFLHLSVRTVTLGAGQGSLGVLHLLADLVAEDLVPVDLGACDWQLASQGLEGGVGHGLVVLTDGRLDKTFTFDI